MDPRIRAARERTRATAASARQRNGPKKWWARLKATDAATRPSSAAGSAVLVRTPARYRAATASGPWSGRTRRLKLQGDNKGRARRGCVFH